VFVFSAGGGDNSPAASCVSGSLLLVCVKGADLAGAHPRDHNMSISNPRIVMTMFVSVLCVSAGGGDNSPAASCVSGTLLLVGLDGVRSVVPQCGGGREASDSGALDDRILQRACRSRGSGTICYCCCIHLPQ